MTLTPNDEQREYLYRLRRDGVVVISRLTATKLKEWKALNWTVEVWKERQWKEESQ